MQRDQLIAQINQMRVTNRDKPCSTLTDSELSVYKCWVYMRQKKIYKSFHTVGTQHVYVFDFVYLIK